MTAAEPGAGALFDEDYLHFFRVEQRQRGGDDEAEVDLARALLSLRTGDAVLDLGCGQGRHANRLAAHGCRVVGLDRSATLLAHARREAAEFGVPVDYVRADVHRLPMTTDFDAVLSMSTAFGYGDDDANRAVLGEVRRVLRPEGAFLLDLDNHAFLLREDGVARVVDDGRGLLVDQSRLDPTSGRNHVTRSILRHDRVRRVRYSVRVFTFPELRDWLHTAGFGRVDGYDERGGPLTTRSRRMLVRARA